MKKQILTQIKNEIQTLLPDWNISSQLQTYLDMSTKISQLAPNDPRRQNLSKNIFVFLGADSASAKELGMEYRKRDTEILVEIYTNTVGLDDLYEIEESITNYFDSWGGIKTINPFTLITGNGTNQNVRIERPKIELDAMNQPWLNISITVPVEISR